MAPPVAPADALELARDDPAVVQLKACRHRPQDALVGELGLVALHLTLQPVVLHAQHVDGLPSQRGEVRAGVGLGPSRGREPEQRGNPDAQAGREPTGGTRTVLFVSPPRCAGCVLQKRGSLRQRARPLEGVATTDRGTRRF